MPQVPRYTNPQVKSEALPGARVTTERPIEAFGGGQSLANVTRASNQISDMAADIAQKERARANQIRLLEERRALNEWEYKNLYDPKTGAVNRVGKDAFGLHESLSSDYDKFTQERKKGLASGEQQAAFDQMAESRRESMSSWVAGHVNRQTQVVEEAEFKASLESSKERGSIDPRNAKSETTFIQQETMRRGQQLGWGQEQLNQALRSEESDLHYRAVNRMLAKGQDLAAESYFKQVEGRLDPDVATKLTKDLEEGSLRGASQRQALEITAHHYDLNSAMNAVDKIDDPKVQDATRQRVKERFQERERSQDMSRERQFQNAWNILEETKSLDKVPPNMIRSLKPNEQSAMAARARQLAENQHVSTDWNDYYNLKSIASVNETRDEFLTTNLLLYRTKMADPEFKELVNLQASLRKGDHKAAKVLDGFRTDQSIVSDALNSAGIDPTPKQGKADATKVALFRRKVDEEIIKVQERSGKKATSLEVQGIVDNLMVQGVTQKGWFFDTKKRAFELNAGESLEIKATDVPKPERMKIEDALRRKGLPVTEKSVLELYSRKLSRGAN